MTSHPRTLQGIITSLQDFWSQQGCCLLPSYDVSIGAGTSHPATTLYALGPKPWRAAFVQPSRRPKDGRYGEAPQRVTRHHQFQVVLKPSPEDIQALMLASFYHIGIPQTYDIAFIENDWENPSLGASGLGWEVVCNGLEILQFTYFQQIGGIACHPVCGELAYGLERIALIVQNKDNFYDLQWNDTLTYGDLFQDFEREFSAYYFEHASVPLLNNILTGSEEECRHLLQAKLIRPAYETCLHMSHAFNCLDSRGCLSATERVDIIARIRSLACQCFQLYVAEEAHAHSSA